MKKILLMVGLICFMIVPSLVLAADCDPEKSPTKVVVTLDGKDSAFCSVKEAYDAAFVKREGAKPDDLNNQIIPIKMKDFQTGKMFNFYDGFFIIETSMEVKDANPPYVLGFSTREGAWKYWEANQAKIAGRVVNFETATREYAKASQEKKEPTKGEAAAAGHLDKLLKKKQP